MLFSKTLINWYLKNKRDLPWRETQDPYRIWLSEIILQQTRIEQGLPYYFKFTDAFPNIFELAQAPLEKVLKLWQGLGYYSRARNLHKTAKYVSQDLNGKFPGSYKELLKLKGVGDYTASAVASFSYGEAVAVVDGNVYRVLSRYFGIETPANSAAGIKEFKALATELLNTQYPGEHNQAIMEFGALQCRPQLPLCGTCPLSQSCLALKDNKIGELPVKIKKGKIKKRFFNYLVILSEENNTVLEKRRGKGIWEGLYQFPLIESDAPLAEDDLLLRKDFKKFAENESLKISLYNNNPVIHKLSHQHIYTHFWILETTGAPGDLIPLEKVQEYPVPVLVANFLNEYGW